jgi:hypothetical protein
MIFAMVLQLTDQLVAGYLAYSLNPLLSMRFGVDNYIVGFGDVLVLLPVPGRRVEGLRREGG